MRIPNMLPLGMIKGVQQLDESAFEGGSLPERILRSFKAEYHTRIGIHHPFARVENLVKLDLEYIIEYDHQMAHYFLSSYSTDRVRTKELIIEVPKNQIQDFINAVHQSKTLFKS